MPGFYISLFMSYTVLLQPILLKQAPIQKIQSQSTYDSYLHRPTGKPTPYKTPGNPTETATIQKDTKPKHYVCLLHRRTANLPRIKPL